MIRLIGLTGPARCGKNTVADLLWTHFRTSPCGFTDPLKDAAIELLGVTDVMVYGDGYDREQIMPEWGFSMRYFLQRLGTEGMRDLFREDFWVNRMRLTLDLWDKYRDERDTDIGGTVITDLRYDNEADFIRERGGCIWHVERPDPNGLDAVAQSHASEAGVEFKQGDVRLRNDGSLDLLESRVIFAWTQLE